MWKFSLVLIIGLSLVGCAQQSPSRVVAAKPSIKRIAAKHLPKSKINTVYSKQRAIATRPAPSKNTVVDRRTSSKANLEPIWGWPAKGNILTRFSAGQSTFKGIDIAGIEGAAVLAAGDGVVVYSGNSLRGYGNLIIIKHNKNYLTAYAHNRQNMVKEGERVLLGQRIAEMGQTGTDKVKLHFEVRYQGKPIDPQQVLPAR